MRKPRWGDRSGGFPPWGASSCGVIRLAGGRGSPRYPLCVASKRQIWVKDVPIGGGAPVVVQTMTKTETANLAATMEQIQRVAEAGSDLVRVAVPREADVEALKTIVVESPIPVIADIHFNYTLALKAIDAGAHCIRLNPGNIGGPDKVAEVAKRATQAGVPMRIGVNSGSLPKHLHELERSAPVEALVAAAVEFVELMEGLEFEDFKVSIKSTNVPNTIAANRLLASKIPYPIHLGITEAGTKWSGSLKSAVGLGTLLADGVGDTIRISLSTFHAEEEVKVAWEILKALGLRERGPVLIACPTCGRLQFDMDTVVAEIETRLEGYGEPIEVAVLGCAVNGIGEASHADFGITGAKNEGLIFAHGKPLRKVPQAELVDALFEEIDKSLDRGKVDVDAREAADRGGLAAEDRGREHRRAHAGANRPDGGRRCGLRGPGGRAGPGRRRAGSKPPARTRKPRRSRVVDSPGRHSRAPIGHTAGQRSGQLVQRIVARESVAVALVPEVEEGDREHPAVERRVCEALAERAVGQMAPDLGAQHALQGPALQNTLISAHGRGRESSSSPRDRRRRESVVGGWKRAHGRVRLFEQRPIDLGVELLRRAGRQQRGGDLVVGAGRDRGQVGPEDGVGGEGDPPNRSRRVEGQHDLGRMAPEPLGFGHELAPGQRLQLVVDLWREGAPGGMAHHLAQEAGPQFLRHGGGCRRAGSSIPCSRRCPPAPACRAPSRRSPPRAAP